MAYTPKEWQKGGPGYKTNDYLYAEDINKMIYLLNQFVVFNSDNTFKGIKIPKTGLTLVTENDKEWLLTIDENGILQTEEIIKE